MSTNNARLAAISAVNNYKPFEKPLNFKETSAKDIFGSNVFGDAEMKARLPKNVYKALQRVIRRGDKMDPQLADTRPLIAGGASRTIRASAETVNIVEPTPPTLRNTTSWP